MDIEILFQRTPPAGVLSAAMSVGCPTAYFTSCKPSYEEFKQVVTHSFAGGRGSRRPLPFFCAVSIILYGIGEKIRLDMGCMPEMFFSEPWHDPCLSCLPLF